MQCCDSISQYIQFSFCDLKDHLGEMKEFNYVTCNEAFLLVAQHSAWLLIAISYNGRYWGEAVVMSF